MTQFLRDQAIDSEEVVTPLMLDGTYLSRNFATLGPMIRQPPCDLSSRSWSFLSYRSALEIFIFSCLLSRAHFPVPFLLFPHQPGLSLGKFKNEIPHVRKRDRNSIKYKKHKTTLIREQRPDDSQGDWRWWEREWDTEDKDSNFEKKEDIRW